MTRKEILRHELLNIFTILLFTLDQKTLPKKEREEMKQQIRLCGFLVEHEAILLGKTPQFSWQQVAFCDFLEMLLMVHEGLIQQRDIHVTLPTENPQIKIDQYYFREALQLLLEHLFAFATEITFFIEDNKALLIKHNIPKGKLPPIKPLDQCITKQGIQSGTLPYYLALQLFTLLAEKPTFTKNTIFIPLPHPSGKEEI